MSETRKAPGALDPAVVPPPLRYLKYILVTQDTSSSLCSERRNKYLFGRAKSGGLGQVSKKKKSMKKNPGTTGPRPDGGVKNPKDSLGALIYIVLHELLPRRQDGV